MAQLLVDTQVIGRNTEVVAALLREQGLDLVGVTKGSLGEPRVGAAMLQGGAVALADTRDLNLRRLREGLPRAELHRIHLPPVGIPFERADVSYVSSLVGAHAVATVVDERAPDGMPRRVVVVVETGDMREGVPFDELTTLVEAIESDRRLAFSGIATNYACLQGGAGGIRQSLQTIALAARELEAAGHSPRVVSGGNSSVLILLRQEEVIPAEITELRCGEALLLGQDALVHLPLDGCGSSCVLRADVLEEYTKMPSIRGGSTLVLGLGSQDLASGEVSFVEPGLTELGRSGDYLVVENEADGPRMGIGSTVEMIPSYEALVAAWTSPFVELRLR